MPEMQPIPSISSLPPVRRLSAAYAALGPYLSKIRVYAMRLRSFQPLTVRGVIALIAAYVLITFYALPESDLVAFTLGGGFLLVTLFALVGALVIRLRLRKTLSAKMFFDMQSALSKQEVDAGIVLEGSSLLPFFTLYLERRFMHAGPKSAVHIIKGQVAPGEKRRLTDSVYFPHRGFWEIRALSCKLYDPFGVVCFTWELEVSGNVEVSAKTIPIRPLPIVSSSTRAGEDLSISRERSGDLFDIKPYDPSDGIARILWKTFARSGQLVVRRPEPAIIPEGEVALYLVAARSDDYVVGALQSYLDLLEANQVAVLFGTDGSTQMGSVSGAAAKSLLKNSSVISGRDVIQHVMNRSVWSPEVGTGSGFEMFLEDLKSRNRFISRVVVFASQSPSASTDQDWFTEISKISRAHAVLLTIVLVPKNLELEQIDFGRRTSNLSSHVNTATLKKHQISTGILGFSKGSKARVAPNRELVSKIARSGAELLECESHESLN